MPVLFISHSSNDDAHANALAAWLRAMNRKPSCLTWSHVVRGCRATFFRGWWQVVRAASITSTGPYPALRPVEAVGCRRPINVAINGRGSTFRWAAADLFFRG